MDNPHLLLHKPQKPTRDQTFGPPSWQCLFYVSVVSVYTNPLNVKVVSEFWLEGVSGGLVSISFTSSEEWVNQVNICKWFVRQSTVIVSSLLSLLILCRNCWILSIRLILLPSYSLILCWMVHDFISIHIPCYPLYWDRPLWVFINRTFSW